MIRRCQSKFAFSKQEWYTYALRALVSKEALSPKTMRSLFIGRPFATLASTLADPKVEEMTNTPTTSIIPIPRIIPRTTQPPDESIANSPLVSDTLDDIVYHRCAGFKKSDGRRCTRILRSDYATVDQGHYYCHHHDPRRPTKRTNDPKRRKRTRESNASCETSKEAEAGFLTDESQTVPAKLRSAKKIYDCWDLWISPHIKKLEKKMIKQEMQRPLSGRDKPGYIYAYQLAEGRRSGAKCFAYFKIGRTTNPHRRMYQIAHSCDFVPKIIELFPSFPTTNRPLMPTNLEPLEEELLDLPKCPVSHRVERLIHLELLGLSHKAEFKCPKCGAIHREWFKIRRGRMPDGRLMTDQELYSLKVRPIILKWIQFGVAASVFLPNNKQNLS